MLISRKTLRTYLMNDPLLDDFLHQYYYFIYFFNPFQDSVPFFHHVFKENLIVVFLSIYQGIFGWIL